MVHDCQKFKANDLTSHRRYNNWNKEKTSWYISCWPTYHYT